MNTTLKNIIYYICAVVISKGIGALRTFGVAKILNPADYGIWITILLVVSYAPIVSLGVVEALVKQVPFYLGEGDFVRQERIDSCVFGSVILSCVALLVIGLFTSFFFDYENIILTSSDIVLVVFVGIATLFYGYFYHRLIAYQKFQNVSIIDTTYTTSGFLFVLGFAYYLGIKGAIIGLLVSTTLTSIYTMYIGNRTCGLVKPVINFKLLAELIKIGLPITFLWWLFIIQSSVDRIISMSMLGKTATGYYGIGIALVTLITLVPQAIGRVLYPKVNEKLGRNVDREDMINIVILPNQIISIIMSFAIAFLLSILPIGYQIFFPEYLPGLKSAQLLIVGAFFFSLIRIGSNLLVATGLQNKLLKYLLICFVFNIVGNIFAVKIGLGILGIAISTSLSQALLATMTLSNVISKMYDKSKVFNYIISIYFPIIILICIWVLNYFVSQLLTSASMINEILYIVCFNILFIAIMVTSPVTNTKIKEILNLVKGAGMK